MFFLFNPFHMIIGAFMLFVLFAFGSVIELIFQSVFVIIIIGVVLAIIFFISNSMKDARCAELRREEGTDKLGCGAFSRKVVKNLNAKLAEDYGDINAELVHENTETLNDEDTETYSLNGAIMEDWVRETDSLFSLTFTTSSKHVTGFRVKINDVSRRPGVKVPGLYLESASLDEIIEKSFVALRELYDRASAETSVDAAVTNAG